VESHWNAVVIAERSSAISSHSGTAEEIPRARLGGAGVAAWKNTHCLGWRLRHYDIDGYCEEVSLTIRQIARRSSCVPQGKGHEEGFNHK
jgi:hypothetical protein